MSNVNFIVAQILGLTATVILLSSYLVKNKSKFLLLNFTGDVVYGLTFIFVNSWGTGLIALLSCAQSLMFYFFDKKGKRLPKPIAFVLIIAFMVIGALNFENYWDLIPMFTYSWFTIALYFENVKAIRMMYILPNAVLVVYDIMVMAYANAFEDGLEAIFLLTVVIIDFAKSRKMGKKFTWSKATLLNYFRFFNGIKGVENFDLQSAKTKVTTSINQNIYTMYKKQTVIMCPIDEYG